jgi:hypothetical protein
VIATIPVTIAPRPPASPPPAGGLPLAPPIAVIRTHDTPAGTVYVCSPPVYEKLSASATATDE